METKQHEYLTISESGGGAFIDLMNDAEARGWRMVSTNCSYHITPMQEIESWMAILQRQIGYVENRIAELEGAIEFLEEDVKENREWYDDDHYRPATLTEIKVTKEAILLSQNELKLLTEESHAKL